MMTRAVLVALLVAACGGDENTDPQPDAPTGGGSNVTALAACPATVDATMMTMTGAFSPMAVTVPVGGTLKITSTTNHPVGPDSTTNTDNALTVPQGTTKCFQIDTAGTYGIKCMFHGFLGSITAQ